MELSPINASDGLAISGLAKALESRRWEADIMLLSKDKLGIFRIPSGLAGRRLRRTGSNFRFDIRCLRRDNSLGGVWNKRKGFLKRRLDCSLVLVEN